MEQVDFQDNGTKVAAVNTKTYIFQRDMSRGPESDLIRTVNIPAMVSHTKPWITSVVWKYIIKCFIVFYKYTSRVTDQKSMNNNT